MLPGSSPLARGLRGSRVGSHRLDQDHPRSRGVYVIVQPGAGEISGSSPLARGLRSPRSSRPGISRIIPARAGFTSSLGRSWPKTTDHPRSRGVYERVGGQTEGLDRIIPARAGFTPPPPTTRRSSGDHPRSRGVYPGRAVSTRGGRGSSPLARGLPGRHLQGGDGAGIIPARAGFTHSTARPGLRLWDHPRSRGVYRRNRLLGASQAGSSPLARGLRPVRGTRAPRTGIIPARAGFTPAPERATDPPPDHPRSRGVYTFVPPLRAMVMGSSPLARGLRQVPLGEQDPDGIIPARAGFTSPRRRGRPGGWDHPRSRGVYGAQDGAAGAVVGSSPLARGLRAGLGAGGGMGRIIPARAGFTAATSRTPCVWGDHPRSRGVYPSPVWERATTRGSSPLARGLQEVHPLRDRAAGIIPARAGFTGLAWGRSFSLPDHPRSRGVYPLLLPAQDAGMGSSPLARGLPTEVS